MRKLNWHPDLPDHRDFKYGALRAVAPAAALPLIVDLKPNCSEVFDQGDIGSCTGNATAGALEYLELQEMKMKVAGPEVFDPKSFQHFSRLFIYYNERRIEGTTGQDAGATLRDGVKAVSTYGACRETIWGYSNNLTFRQPSKIAYTEAAKHKVTSYFRLSTLDDMKHCLAAGFPFIFGFTVYDYFMSDEMAKTGELKLPTPSESCQGGHAVMAVGYNDTHKRFTIRNSWGKDWGLGGYFHMPYDYITNADLADDFWTIRR